MEIGNYKRLEESGKPAAECRSLVKDLIDELYRAIGLIREIDDDAYISFSARSGSVGAQFRHNLDLANALLRGIPNGRIDYNDRERDPLVETDRRYAITRYVDTIDRLIPIDRFDLEQTVFVHSEFDRSSRYPSLLGREIEFVLSHTVHHHALIAEKLSASYQVAGDFGVARSTLEFWRSEHVN